MALCVGPRAQVWAPAGFYRLHGLRDPGFPSGGRLSRDISIVSSASCGAMHHRASSFAHLWTSNAAHIVLTRNSKRRHSSIGYLSPAEFEPRGGWDHMREAA